MLTSVIKTYLLCSKKADFHIDVRKCSCFSEVKHCHVTMMTCISIHNSILPYFLPL